MRYRVGDLVRITKQRDINLPHTDVKKVGLIGSIVKIHDEIVPLGLNAGQYWGPYEVEIDSGWHYCKEEEIALVSPATPRWEKVVG